MKTTFTDLHNQALTMGEHIEQVREAYEALERERDALVAHVERLHEALSKISLWIDDDPVMCQEIIDTAKMESPSQSLNHIKAQVEEETIEYCAKCFGIDEATAEFVRSMPRKYAKQAGSTVEEGE